MINKHILAEKPVPADMLKADCILNKLELLVILLLKADAHSASTNAVKSVVIKVDVFFSCDFVFHTYIITEFTAFLYEDFIRFLYNSCMILTKNMLYCLK